MKARKVIAREFLILVAHGALFVLGYMATYPVDFIDKRIKESAVKELERYILEKGDSAELLLKPFKAKEERRIWFYQQMEKYEATGNYSNSNELWQRVETLNKSDSIIQNWQGRWSPSLTNVLKEVGFADAVSFNTFIESNSYTQEEIDSRARVKTLTDQIDEIYSKKSFQVHYDMDMDERLDFSLICLIVVGAFAYPVRYLIYAIRWSIATLREK
ncbi:hypothetical protein [uncultured Imperialibacter sp.]|uniref:hypothetical protein n=1 Tax=uncultured Imperialibacter sp. TaxID=1672639 RepID=UPI0030DA9212|tara:strand:+ start:271 stop:918 length:648 start_codon:yes stop_codon:yes gene_type:complete